MGPGGALNGGAPGPSEEPVESLASGLGLPPRWPGLLGGLHHDAGHLGSGASPRPGQLLGLKDGLSPGQAGLRLRQWPGLRLRQPGQLGLDLPLQVLLRHGHAVHLCVGSGWYRGCRDWGRAGNREVPTGQAARSPRK